MLKLFSFEFQKNPIKKYLLTVFAIATFLLGMTCLFAYIPHKNSKIAIEMAIVHAIAPVFANYRNIVALTDILSMVCFTVFATIVFNQFVINDFTGKRFYLLLSYPIKKSSIFLVKVIAATLISIVAMLLCNMLVFTVFFTLESQFSVVTSDTLSFGLFYDTAKLSLLFSVIGSAIGLLSMEVGFMKKSSHIALITAFTCAVLLSNLLSVSLLADPDTALLRFTILTIVLAAVAVVLTIGLSRRINLMEGE